VKTANSEYRKQPELQIYSWRWATLILVISLV